MRQVGDFGAWIRTGNNESVVKYNLDRKELPYLPTLSPPRRLDPSRRGKWSEGAPAYMVKAANKRELCEAGENFRECNHSWPKHLYIQKYSGYTSQNIRICLKKTVMFLSLKNTTRSLNMTCRSKVKPSSLQVRCVSLVVVMFVGLHVGI